MATQARKASTSGEVVVDAEYCDIENCEADSNEFIECSLCCQRAHKGCLKMDKRFFDTLRSKKYSGVSWKCDKCVLEPVNASLDFSKMMESVKNELKSEILENIKKEMKSLTNIIEEKFISLNYMKPQKLNASIQSQILSEQNIKLPIKHTICIKPKDNELNFSKANWNEVVKKGIQPKLKGIPVTKCTHSKDGKGVLQFPDSQSRDRAAKELKQDYVLETQDRPPEMILPKMKVSYISKSSYNNLDKDTLKASLKQDIMEKIRQFVI